MSRAAQPRAEASPGPPREPSPAARMAPEEPEPIALALDVADPALADRLEELLASVAGLRLVPPGEPAQVVLTARGASAVPQGLALTRREGEVLAILAEGATNGEIARRLGISPHTAKFHVRSLYEKLDATGRVDAVAHAARIGAIQL